MQRKSACVIYNFHLVIFTTSESEYQIRFYQIKAEEAQNQVIIREPDFERASLVYYKYLKVRLESIASLLGKVI